MKKLDPVFARSLEEHAIHQAAENPLPIVAACALVMRCSAHPEYRAIRKPKLSCSVCVRLFEVAQLRRRQNASL